MNDRADEHRTPAGRRVPGASVAAERLAPAFPSHPVYAHVVAEAREVRRREDEIIAAARAEAERLVTEAESDIARDRDAARHEARDAVRMELAGLLDGLRAAVASERADLDQTIERVAFRLAREVLDIEFEARPELVRELVRQAVQGAEKYERITVYMHPDDLTALGDDPRALLGDTVEVVEDPQSPRRSVRVRTELGDLVNSLDGRLEQLGAALFPDETGRGTST